jgi:hypothetical protein
MLILLSMICLVAFLAGSGPAEKMPKIKFKEEAWDFGKVKQDQSLSYEFVFKNEGDAPLVIQKVDTSCGCTAALVSDRKVEPGKEGKIKVNFNSQGYSGAVSKFIYVESNDPAEPRKELKISADIDVPPQPKIDLDRYSYDAGLLLQGEDLKARFMIKNRGELELRVECSHKTATFSLNGKDVNFPLKVAAGKEAELDLKMSLPERIGLVREYILIKSNDPLRATVSLSLNGYIVTKEQLKELFTRYRNILQ